MLLAEGQTDRAREEHREPGMDLSKNSQWVFAERQTHSVEKGRSFQHTVSWGSEVSAGARDKTN